MPWLSVGLYGFVLCVAAFALNYFVQLGYFQMQGDVSWQWISEHWQLFLASSFIIFVVMLFFLCLFRNTLLSIVVPGGILVLFSYANYLVILYRGIWSPLHFDNLRLSAAEAGSLLAMMEGSEINMFAAIALSIIALSIMGVWLVPKWRINIHTRVLLGLVCFLFLYIVYEYAVRIYMTQRVVMFILAATILVYAALALLKKITIKAFVSAVLVCFAFILPVMLLSQNPIRQFVSSHSNYPDGHTSNRDFYTNGVLFAFIRSMSPKELMARPKNFSTAKLEQIINEYTIKAQEINESRNGLEDKPNIILIMSEAFSDPLVFEEFYFSRDPIPFTRYMMQNSPSGQALVNVFGGNTIVPEFQALTSFFTPWFERNSNFYHYIANMRGFPSIVSYLNARDYTSTAVHPYIRAWYRRDKAYSVLGFDSFLADDNMRHTYVEGHWIADSAAFSEVLDIIKGNIGQFVFLITMQNHFPYPAGRHPDVDIYADGNFNEDILDSLETHARGLSISDDAFRSFIRDLQYADEPTLLMFFGDHLPASVPSSFFEEHGYTREQFETPMFLFSNYSPLEIYEFGSVSPIFFSNIILDTLNAKISPFHALLAELFQHVQAINGDWFIDSENIILPQSDWDERTIALIDKLKIIQYDILSAKKLSLSAGFFDMAL